MDLDYVDDEIGELYIHRWLDAQDYNKQWFEAQIIEIDKKDGNNRIKIHFKGYTSKFDEWIDLKKQSERVRDIHTFTKPLNNKIGNLTFDDFRIGLNIDLLDSMDKWYKGKIIDINNDKKLIKVHYNDWGNKYDEWLNYDSYRIAPYNTMTNIEYVKTLMDKQQQIQQQKQQQSSSNKDSHKLIHEPPNKKVKIEESVSDDDVNVIDTDDDDDNEFSEKKDDIGDDSDNEIEKKKNNNNDNNNNNNKRDYYKNPPSNETEREELNKINNEQREKFKKQYKASIEDEKNFRNKLKKKGLIIKEMGDDGNCLFRSISHQIYGTQKYHMLLREKCVNYLKCEKNYFANYVEGGFDYFNLYCLRMSKDAVWGDNLEIQVFSEIYQRSIEIYAYDDKPMKTFSNENNNNNKQPIKLSYHFNSHYNSIISQKNHEFIYNPKDFGKIEDERIKLSSLRSTQALNKTLQESSLDDTNTQIFNNALLLSRKQFDEENNKKSRQQLDQVISESLKSFNNNMLKKAINESEQQNIQQQLDQIEKNELQKAQKESLNKLHPAIQAVMDEGYTMEDATMALSVYESKGLNQQQLIQQMLEYIKIVKLSAMYDF